MSTDLTKITVAELIELFESEHDSEVDGSQLFPMAVSIALTVLSLSRELGRDVDDEDIIDIDSLANRLIEHIGRLAGTTFVLFSGITKDRLYAITRQYNKAGMTAEDDLRKITKRGFDALIKHCGEMLRDVGDWDLSSISPELRQIIREVIEPQQELLSTVKETGEALIKRANCFEEILREPPPTEDDFDTAKPPEPPRTEEALPVVTAEQLGITDEQLAEFDKQRALDQQRVGWKDGRPPWSRREEPRKQPFKPRPTTKSTTAAATA
jgi:hypothetical protein